MAESKIVRSITMDKGREGAIIALWRLPDYTYMVEVTYTNTNWATTTRSFNAYIPGVRGYVARIGVLYCRGWR